MTEAYAESQALLITENARTGALLKQTFEKQGILKSLKTINHCKSAVAYLRKIGPYKNSRTPNMVFFDFSEAGGDCISRLQELVYGKHLPRVPVIVFTTRNSQRHLADMRDKDGNAGHLAALELEHFLRRFQSLDRASFLKAARQLSVFGPIVVQLPDSFTGLIADDNRQTA